MTDEQLQILYRLVQKVDDFQAASSEWQSSHDKKSDDWRKTIDDRLDILERFVGRASWSYKLLTVMAVFVAGFWKVWLWVKDHIRP